MQLENGDVRLSNNDCILLDDAPKTQIIDKKEMYSNDSNSMPLIKMPPPTQIQQKPDIFGVYRDKRLMSDNFNDSAVSSIHNLSVDSLFDSPMYKERHVKLADAEKGLEVFGRQLAREQNVNWKEYWSFLGGFIDISSQNGLEKLEAHLKKNKIIHNGGGNDKSNDEQLMITSMSAHNLSVSSLCGALDKLNVRENNRSLTNHHNTTTTLTTAAATANNDLSCDTLITSQNAYLCAEKSCQVYAKRMTKLIVQNLSSIVLINDSLKSELKRLKSLIFSYREDIRFQAVNFQSIHSRFADLIVAYLKYDHSDIDLNRVHDVLQQIYKIKSLKSKQLTTETTSATLESTTIDLHLDCLLQFLFHYLNQKDNIIPPEIFTTERDCVDIWSVEQKCKCIWKTDNSTTRFTRSIKRNSKRSFSKNESTLNESQKKFVNDWRGHSIDDSDDEFLVTFSFFLFLFVYCFLNLFFFIFQSDSGSENDLYFTPPESPRNLNDSDDSFEDCDITFNNYILG